MSLEKLKLHHSSLSNNIYAGYVNKKGNMFTQKVDITQQFWNCLLSRCSENLQEIELQSNDGKKFIITVKEVEE